MRLSVSLRTGEDAVGAGRGRARSAPRSTAPGRVDRAGTALAVGERRSHRLVDREGLIGAHGRRHPRRYRPAMTNKLPDVWATRDYPVLREVARRIDAGGVGVQAHDVAAALGMTQDDVERAAKALERRGLVICTWFMGGEGPDFDEVDGQAYLLTGLHPDGDDAVSRLVDALRKAADQNNDPTERGKLRQVADQIGGLSRDVAAGVMTAVLTGGLA